MMILTADFFFDIYQGTGYIRCLESTGLQIFRIWDPTNDIYDIPYAPQNGWES